MTIELYDDRDALAGAAAARIESELKAALAARGAAGLILSGGSTPGPVYEALSGVDLGWERVTVGLADERWVDADHPASNAALVARTLLQDKAVAATFLPMKTEHERAAEAVEALDARYAALDDRLDVMVLGMGPDGHSLSWFPDAEGLATALDTNAASRVAEIMARKSAVTGDNLERMTLTARCVAAARHVLLMITGEEKKRVLESGADDLPIRQVERLAGERLAVMWAA